MQQSSGVQSEVSPIIGDWEQEGVRQPADSIITARHVGKMYRLYDRPQDRLKGQILRRLGKSYGREFWALQDVSFTVQRGEVLGIIGRNGSGKSTLLQILAGVLQTTTGTVEIQGRVAALLELGSGFNPEYTGRENVFMNGAILGISHVEMEERFEEIAAFADIGTFIDQPAKSYSSGMLVRLAFAVQTFVHPDILIIDEVLAVGDVAFQRKCYRRIDALRERGCTILLVSHDINTVTHLCSRALLIEGGHLITQGAPAEIGEQYQKLLFGEEMSSPVQEYGDGSAEFLDVWFENHHGERVASIASDTDFCYCYRLRFLRPIAEPVFGMRMKSVQGVMLTATNSQMMGLDTGRYETNDEVVVRWKASLPLTPGYYFFSCGCSYPDVDRFLCRRTDALKLTVIGSTRNMGFVNVVHAVSVDIA